MFDLIMYFILIFFGAYIDFMSRVKWIKALYKFKDCNESTEAGLDEEGGAKIKDAKNE